MDKEVALDVTVEVCVTWKIGVQHELLDAMILPTHPTQSDIKSHHTSKRRTSFKSKKFKNDALVHLNINENQSSTYVAVSSVHACVALLFMKQLWVLIDLDMNMRT